jgi:hypothetical protein
MGESMFAQTKVQLFNQLQRDAYQEADVRLVLKAFEFGQEIFSGRFQYCGKPFLAHGIGTASILSSLRASAEMVAAGLIHNAYSFGDFGYRFLGSVSPKRQYVQKRIGPNVERYLSRFLPFSIAPNTLWRIYENYDSYGEFDRQLLLLSLAENLEKYQNGEPLYRASLQNVREFLSNQGHLLIELSERLHAPFLAEHYSKCISEVLRLTLPEELRQAMHEGSFFVSPRSSLPNLIHKITRHFPW